MSKPEEEDRKEKYARLSLYANTLFMLATAKSLVSPTLLFSIAFGIVGSEFAQFILAWQLLTLKGIYENHPNVLFGHWTGKLCLGIECVTLSIVLKNLLEGIFKVPGQFSQALRKVNIEPRLSASWQLGWRALALLPLFSVARLGRTVKITRNIPYAELAPKMAERWQRTPELLQNLNMLVFRGWMANWLSVDVYAPPLRADGRLRPVCMYIHGGGWLGGDKFAGGLGLMNRLAARGVVVVSANYRLAPDVTMDVQVKDCKRALLFVKRNCAQWGGDPNNVFVAGESAGGHLSALVGCTANYAPLQPEEFPNEDTSVAGALPIYGVFDMTDSDGHLTSIKERYLGMPIGVRPLVSLTAIQQIYSEETKHYWEEVSPTIHLRRMQQQSEAPKYLPPYFITHGTLDSLASHGDAKQFYYEYQRLKEKFPGLPDAAFVSVSGGVHGYGYFPSPRGNSLGDAFADFIFHHAALRNKI